MRIMNSCLVPMLFLTASCIAMQKGIDEDPSSEFKKISLKKNYTYDPNNPIPLLLNQERVQEYCHWYEPTPGTKLPLKKHNEYCDQFENSIIRGGQKTYDILTKKNLNTYNETPKTYLQDMSAVICFLYSQFLDKSTAECGPKKWSLILDDQDGLWRNFFINEYLRLTSNNKKYIASITTSHLINLTLRAQYGITTDIAPESIKPYCLPNNDDTILVIPNFEKKWLFLKTGQDAKTGWLTWSIRSGCNWALSQFRKNNVLHSNNKPAYNKEYVPTAIVTKMSELFPETLPEKMWFLHDIYTALKEKEQEDFGKEKNEAIKSFIYELESTYDHLDIRLGNEIIFDAHETRSASLAYALPKKDYVLYFPIISKLHKLKHLIFLHNHVSAQKYSMQDIRNTVNEVIALKSTLKDKISDLHVEAYCISIMDLLRDILDSKECDTHLCSFPIFEQKHHKLLTEKLMAETPIKPESTTPNEFLVLPTDQKQEQE